MYENGDYLQQPCLVDVVEEGGGGELLVVGVSATFSRSGGLRSSPGHRRLPP
jgi:hypothetical protein